MVSQAQSIWVHRHLRQAKGRPADLFWVKGTFFIPDKVQHQAVVGEADVHQKAFLNLLLRARDVHLNEEGCPHSSSEIRPNAQRSQLALSMTPPGYSDSRMKLAATATKTSGPSALLSPSRRPFPTIKRKTARNTPHKTKGAKGMLTNTLCQQAVGLVNGIRG